MLDVGCWMFAPLPFKVQGLFFLLSLLAAPALAKSPDPSFLAGTQAYHAADYPHAVEQFRASATLRPASGTLQNLGLAEWQRGSNGPAILAWEQSLSLDPFNKETRMNLRFARKTAQLEAPDLAWYEVLSSWLPVNWWVWIASISFWLTIAIALLPGILRRRKAGWHQAIAALGLTMFLLTLPALFGEHTRSRLGFVLQKDTPLRLTPTQDAQVITRLASGEPARWEKPRGNYVLIRTNRGLGWVERAQFSRIAW
jgi:tetratricopeptide (TPR) repeat protein